MTSKSVSAPGLSAEERTLLQQSSELLQFQQDTLLKQSKMQEALLPFFAKQQGIELRYNAQGEVVGARQRYTEAQKAERQLQNQTLRHQLQLLQDQRKEYRQGAGLRAKQSEIENKLADRSLRALAGDLPVDPALERELTKQEETLRNRLSQQLGTGYETSSAGIEALQGFSEGAASLRSAAQTGQLTLAEQLGLARSGEGRASTASNQAGLSGFLSLSELGLGQGNNDFARFQQSAFGLPQQLISTGGGITQGYGTAIAPYAQQRSMAYNASVQNANSYNSMLSGIGSTAGNILGFLAFSSRRVKDVPLARMNEVYKGTIVDMKPVVHGIPLYVFKYKDGEERIGTVAEEIMVQMPWVVGKIMGIPAVNYRALAHA